MRNYRFSRIFNDIGFEWIHERKLSISLRVLLGAPSLLRAFTAPRSIYFILCSLVSYLFPFIPFLFFRFVSSFLVSFPFCTLFIFHFLFSFGFCFRFFSFLLWFIHSFACGILFTVVAYSFAPFSFYAFLLPIVSVRFRFVLILFCMVASLSRRFFSFALCSVPFFVSVCRFHFSWCFFLSFPPL